MGQFYSRLSYSIGNEDWVTEQKALQIQPDDHVLCVTASGDRPLNLLLQPCKQITAIDANPVQNALLELKVTAIKALDFDHYVGFLGMKDHPNRWQTFQKLKDHLSPDTFAYWNKHPEPIMRGVLYEGSIEKLTRAGAKWLQRLNGKKINRLFSFQNIEEQRSFIENEWNSKILKRALQISLHPFITRYILRDPGLYAYVDPSIQVAPHLYERILYALKQFSPRESIILSLVLQGKVFEEAFSPYLTEKGSTQIKRQINQINIQTSDLISYLEQAPEKSIDCFSLSDVASYMNYESFSRLSNAMARAAKPGARFCIRQFLSRYDFPAHLKTAFRRNQELEKTLEQEDRCFLYHFLVGTISG